MHQGGLISLIGSGASADVYRIGRGLVLKLFHKHVDPGIADREMQCGLRAHAEGLPVPRPMRRQVVEGRHAIVFEDVNGTPLFKGADGWRIRRARSALRQLASCHADIHARDAAGLIHHQHDILRERIRMADADERLKAAALRQLDALPRGNRLCHGDFHPANAIRTPDGVTAVDWANGCAGDPAGDVARTELLLRYGSYGWVLQQVRPARWFRQRAADFYRHHYSRASGIPAARIAAWYLPVAISCLGTASRMHRATLHRALDRFMRTREGR